MSDPVLDSRRSELELFSLPLPIMVLLSFAPFIMFYLAGTSSSPRIRGCKRLGMKFWSNLSDQFSSRYDKGSKEGKNAFGRPRWRVKALFVFPIKSCQGIELRQNKIISIGMKYDRQFVFAQHASVDQKDDGNSGDGKEWKFITQRAYPKLALVRTELWVPDPSTSDYKPYITYVKSGGCIKVSFPHVQKAAFELAGLRYVVDKLLAKIQQLDIWAEPLVEFRVPFEPTAEQIEQMQLQCKVMKIWKDSPEAIDMSPVIPKDALEKLRIFLGIENEFTLFRVQAEKERLIFKNAPPKEELGYQAIHGFTDAYPLHFNNLASIHELATHLPPNFGRLSAIRFRSNIYITGPLPYDEDYWTKVKVGAATYIVTNRTTRCTLPNVDPATGTVVRYQNAKDDKSKALNKLFNEPLKTMKTFRCIDEGAPDMACLGMQMVPQDPEANDIRVGDEIVVLERGKHFKL